MTVFGAVFARAGSKGVPGKNLRKIGGVSLVGRAAKLGSELAEIDQMLCSTDSIQIAAEASRYGALVPFTRPAELAGDDSREWDSWKHLVAYLLDGGASGTDLLVSLPSTAPLRSPEDVSGAIAMFRDNVFDLVLGVSESERSPWFNMVTRDQTGLAELAVDSGNHPIDRRQDAPKSYDITTVVYVTTLDFVRSAEGVLAGKTGSVLVPKERSVDIDTELDLVIAETIFRKNVGT